MTTFGVNVRNYGPTATPRSLRDWVRFAEDTGFGLAVLSDHVAPTPDVRELYPTPFYDPFASAAWLFGTTDQLEIGTSVAVLPYRHPLHTARLASNLDHFSGGRFVLGVGVGWAEQEYAALAVPFDRRGPITDEYLAAIRQAWTSDQVSLDGEFVAYTEVGTGPPPVRVPHPPIWVGGTSPNAIRRTARFGDAWHPNNAPLGWLHDAGLPAIRQAAEDAGRPVPAFCPRLRARLTSGHVPDRPAGVGSLDEVLADLETLVELGAEYIVLDANPDHPRDERPLADDWRDLRRIVEQALARFS